MRFTTMQPNDICYLFVSDVRNRNVAGIAYKLTCDYYLHVGKSNMAAVTILNVYKFAFLT